MRKTQSCLQYLRTSFFRDVMGAVLCGALMLESVAAAAPGWWETRDVLKPGPADDYVALNQGQFKNFVRAAIEEMEEKIPNGGAGQALRDLLAGWRAGPAGQDSYATINQGQVKNVVKLVYNRLKQVGYATRYPWSHGVHAAQDYALANIGQLKNLLNLDFTKDADRDGVPDWLKSVDAAKQFDASSWLPIDAAGTIFADSEHHSRSSQLGYTTRGKPTALPPGAETIQNDPVMSIPGGFKVGPDGSSRYTVRIEAPKGVAGVEPGITLEYNSNVGNGIAGVGWSIGGLTLVSRGPATVDVDGFYDPADFDANDRFYLDGDRLICISGTYGANGSEYRTLKEQFSRVVYHQNSSEEWFEVWTKSGLRMEFGRGAAARKAPPGQGGLAATWALEKVADRLGNYWQVVYCDTTGTPEAEAGSPVLPDHAPLYVRYTGTSAAAPMHEIEFHYEGRPDAQAAYLMGARVVKSRRLKHVEVKTGSHSHRTYTLNYEQSGTTGRSRLKQLGLKAGSVLGSLTADRVCPPTVFTWSEGDSGWSRDHYLSPGFTETQRDTEEARLKLKMPLITMDDPLLVGSYTFSLSSVVDNTGPGGASVNYSSVYQYTTSAMTEQAGAIFTDVNGDGLNDVVTRYAGQRHSGPFRPPVTGQVIAYADDNFFDINNASALLVNQGSGKWDDRSGQFQSTSFPYLLSGFGPCGQFFDMDGDGLPEVISQDASFPRVARLYPPIWNQLDMLTINTLHRITAPFWRNGQDNRCPRNRTSPGIFAESNNTGIWFSDPASPVPWRAATSTESSPTSGYGFPLVVDDNPLQPGSLEFRAVSFSTPLKPAKGWVVADMDGDGDMDVIRAGQGPTPSTLLGNGRELCFGLRNNGPGVTGARWTVMSSGIWQLPLPLVNRNGDKDMGRRLMDMNGDGLPDFVFQRDRPVPVGGPAWPEYEKFETAVYLNRGDAGWEDGGTAWTLPGEGFNFGTYDSYGRTLMDVNADGLPDFVASWKYNDTSNAEQFYQRVYLNTGAGWTADQPEWHLPKALQVAETSPLQSKVVSQTYHRFLADVNGDGQPEFIDVWKDANAEIDAAGIAAPQVWEKTGAGWALMSAWTFPTTVDFLPRPRAFSQPIADAQGGTAKGWLEDWTDSPLKMADMNGDGLVDLLHCDTARTATFWNTSAQEKISQITNGLGVPLAINYETLPRLGAEPDTPGQPRRYVRGTKPSYAQSDVVPAAWVVTDYSTPDGIGGSITSLFRYGGLRRMVDHSLGFEWMEQRTSISNVVQYTEFYQTPREFVGLPKKTQSYHMSGTTKIVLAESVTTYATLDTATALEGSLDPKPKAKFCYASGTTSARRDPENHLLSTTSATCTYDSWGNLLSQSAVGGEGGAVNSTNTYEPAVTTGTDWLIGRPATTSVTRTAPTAQAAGAPPVTTSSAFTYDDATGLLKTATIHPGTGKAVTKTHHRDAFGNIVKTIITAAGEAEAMVSETWYDASGRFPVAAKNSLGHTVVSTYDTTRSLLVGVSESFKDTPPAADATHSATPPSMPAGTAVSTSVHDDWGTVRVSTGPDGLRSVRYTKAFASAAAPFASYFVYEQEEGAPPSITYYDSHHRALLTEDSGFDGTPVLQRVTYDARGRKTHTTDPFFFNASVIPTTQVEYDAFDRLVRSTAPDGTQTTVGYDGLTVTTQIEGTQQRQVVIRDELGRVMQTQDALGNIVSFAYTADDLPLKSVTTPAIGGTATEISSTYDPVTRARLTTTDPNMGTVQLFYDGFGRVVRTLDGMNVETTFTHDRLGRVLHRQTQETATTWTYDLVASGSNGLGQVATVSHTTTGAGPAATTQESATYDHLGRTVRSTLVLAGQPAFNGQYTTTLGYDDLGRVSTTTDPGGFTTQNEYNAFGFKSGLREAHPTQTRMLWRAGAYDAAGRLLQERLGNGITTDSVYHPTRGTLQSATSYRPGLSGGSSRNLQKLELSVSNLGHVDWRKSTTYDAAGTATAREESFTYDDLNRLTSSHVAGQDVQTFVFGADGNITSKTGVGAYTYDSARKHAVVGVASGGIARAYAYDDGGRMTTEHVQQAGQNDRLIRQINYTSFHQPSVITHHASPKLSTDRPEPGGVPGFCQIQFTYGADLQRLIQTRVKGAIKTQTLYLGAYEVREVYESGGSTLVEREERSSFGCGARIRRFSEGTSLTIPVVETEFTLEDHLGSTSAMHNADGEVKQSRGQQPLAERHSYDTWGARRNAATWAPAGPQPAAAPEEEDPPQVSSSNPSGFTGHEMLDDVGLIHMNGRLYDPALGRFCSADPFVQDIADCQSHNRYSYVGNNPLGATDPSGYAATYGGYAIDSPPPFVPGASIITVTILGFGEDGWLDPSSPIFNTPYWKNFAERMAQALSQYLPAPSYYSSQYFLQQQLNQNATVLGQIQSVPQILPGASAVQPVASAASISSIQSVISAGSLGQQLAAPAVQAVPTIPDQAVGNNAIHADAHGSADSEMGEAGGGSFQDGMVSAGPDKRGFFERMLDGALKGDFAEQDNGIAGTIGQTVVGLIPFVGMAADIRDTSAAISKWWKTGEGLGDVGIALLGWAPGGDLLKGIGKVGRKLDAVPVGAASRNFGGARAALRSLSIDEKINMRAMWKDLGGDNRMLRFDPRKSTFFSDPSLGGNGTVNIGGNVFPLIGGTHNRSLMSPRAVLAHELGHVRLAGTRMGALPKNDWRSEFGASYWGARAAPGLSRTERQSLLRDAKDRAIEAGRTLPEAGYSRLMQKIFDF